jgi:hypothetical protein
MGKTARGRKYMNRFHIENKIRALIKCELAAHFRS